MKNGLFILLIMLAVFSCDWCEAQNTSIVVDSELERFPWYESSTDSLKDLPRKMPGSAKSMDRFNVPRHIPKTIPNQTPATPAPTGPPPDFSWAQSLIWILLTVVVFIIVGAFIWIFLKMESTSVSGNIGDDLDQEELRERIKQLPFQLEEEALGDFRYRALEAAKNCEFGRATMMLFSHVLISLDENGLIQLKRGKTNRQYLNELRQHRPLKQYFERVMIPFEDHFFGDHVIEETRYQRCWDGLDDFLSHVRSASEATIA